MYNVYVYMEQCKSIYREREKIAVLKLLYITNKLYIRKNMSYLMMRRTLKSISIIINIIFLVNMSFYHVNGQDENLPSNGCIEALDQMKKNIANETHPLSIAMKNALKPCTKHENGYFDKCLYWGNQYCNVKYKCRPTDKSSRKLRTECVMNENFYFTYDTVITGALKVIPPASQSAKGDINIQLNKYPLCFPNVCLTEDPTKLITWIKDEVDNYVKPTVGNKVEIDIILDLDYPSGITLLTYFNVLGVVFMTFALLFGFVLAVIDAVMHAKPTEEKKLT